MTPFTIAKTMYLSFCILLVVHCSVAFQISPTRTRSAANPQLSTFTCKAYNNDNNNFSNKKPEYSQELLLREEAESPFRNVRFFVYSALGAGALASLAVSSTRVIAATAGINTDLLSESAINAAVDIAGIVVLYLLYQRDVEAQQSKLKRAAKGAVMAKLRVRVSKSIMQGFDEELEDADSSTFSTTMASLRRGRGIEKRVVIAAGGKARISEVLEQANKLDNELVSNDLLIVPIVLPQGIAPEWTDSNSLPKSIGLPVLGGLVSNNWNDFISDEAAEASKQGIDVVTDGFCVVLKKNGRVGQRTKGINLSNMVGNVMARRDAGMDVKNI